jgi:rRNA maturation endonuclease Nob1
MDENERVGWWISNLGNTDSPIYAAFAYQCSICQALTKTPVEVCPACGAKMDPEAILRPWEDFNDKTVT